MSDQDGTDLISSSALIESSDPSTDINSQKESALGMILPLPANYQSWHQPMNVLSSPVSDPPSAISSRNISPIPAHHFDVLEGQFPLWSNSLNHTRAKQDFSPVPNLNTNSKDDSKNDLLSHSQNGPNTTRETSDLLSHKGSGDNDLKNNSKPMIGTPSINNDTRTMSSFVPKISKTNGYFESDSSDHNYLSSFPTPSVMQQNLNAMTSNPGNTSVSSGSHFPPNTAHQPSIPSTAGPTSNLPQIPNKASFRSGMQSPTVPFSMGYSGPIQSQSLNINSSTKGNQPPKFSPGAFSALPGSNAIPSNVFPNMNSPSVSSVPPTNESNSGYGMQMNQFHPSRTGQVPPNSVRGSTVLPPRFPATSSHLKSVIPGDIQSMSGIGINNQPLPNVSSSFNYGPRHYTPAYSGNNTVSYSSSTLADRPQPSMMPNTYANMPPPPSSLPPPGPNSTIPNQSTKIGHPPPPLMTQMNRGPPPVMPTNQTPPIPMFSSGSINTGFSSPNPNQYNQSGIQGAPMSSRTGAQNYPRMPYPNRHSTEQLAPMMNSMSVKEGFSRLWGTDTMDLLQQRNIYPPKPEDPPKIVLPNENLQKLNCSKEIFRCTLNKIPETPSLLSKCKLPLGVLIHPFKDLAELPILQCGTIVRCKSCRTYINPFVHFVDQRRWRCNLCFKVNDIPEEFLFDPKSETYGDPTRRPEIQSSTIEFIAPADYMLRPPQPSCYLYIIDVCYNSVTTGHLEIFCKELIDNIKSGSISGDSRTLMGFITVDSSIHFYSFVEGMAQPHMMIVGDVNDVFIPSPDTLLVNLQTHKELIISLLEQLPSKFTNTHETQSALGAALQAGYKMMYSIGGRITVLQTVLPNYGPGALQPREDPNARASKDILYLTPATDFYKKLALDCSGQQIAVDLFILATQYVDLATLSGISNFSGGCIYYYPTFNSQHNKKDAIRFHKDFQRYVTRKIGYESVMRLRTTRGLAIHTFHGNSFVRSTDLLSLPNINPDAAFGMQIAIEEPLTDISFCSFQAALLYTSSHGERRIRVHTMCIPVSGDLNALVASADQECIVGLLSKMAVDRCISSSVSDAREALLNAVIDSLSAYRATQTAFSSSSGLLAPPNLKLLPLYVLALFKSIAFRIGISTRLDERVWAMNQLKTLPLGNLLLFIYPNLYPVHSLSNSPELCPPRLQLSAEKIDAHGAYLLDTLDVIYLFLGKAVDDKFCSLVLNFPNFTAVPPDMVELPDFESTENTSLRNFILDISDSRPVVPALQIIKDDTNLRSLLFTKLVDDRNEAAPSYIEFLQKLRAEVK